MADDGGAIELKSGLEITIDAKIQDRIFRLSRSSFDSGWR